MKTIFKSLLLAVFAFACSTPIASQEANEVQKIRSIIEAFRHPNLRTTMVLVRQASSQPQTPLMQLAVSKTDYSYIRSTAVALLSVFSDDPAVMEFLEARIADTGYFERRHAMISYAQGFYEKHPERVMSHLRRCSRDPKHQVRDLASRLIMRAEAGSLIKNDLPGDYRELHR